jgi:hypothetical protein
MIKVVTGIDLYNDINKYDVILVGTNIYGYMAHGFQRKVMLNYPYVQDLNMSSNYGDEKKLGSIIECKKENNPIFVLLYINKGLYRKSSDKDYLEYEALEKCMQISNILYKGKKVACTFLGASKFDGNGNKERIFEILSKNSDNIDLSVYDYEQLSRHDELKNVRISELKLKEIDADAYYEAVKKRKAEAEERFKNNGHARY